MRTTNEPNRVDKARTVPELFNPKVSYKRGRRLATVIENGILSYNFLAPIEVCVLPNFWIEILPASAPCLGVPVLPF